MHPNDKDKYMVKDFFEVIFEEIFESMKKMYRDENLDDNMTDTNYDGFRLNRNFVQVFGVNITPHGKINVPEFENERPVSLDGQHKKSEKNEFSTELIKTDEEIFVTMNIPGVEKEDIVINVTDDSLEILINTHNIKYHKTHKLPCNVKPKVTISSYKNGVLDIIMKRKEKTNTEGKYKANVD